MSKQFFSSSLLIAAIFLLTAATHGGSPPADKSAQEPIVVTADHMDADELGKKVTFTGKVSLKKENMTMTADLMTVFYDAVTKEVKLIDAHGNVVVRKEGRTAFADLATYYRQEEKIIMTGSARIIENENQLGGDKITLFLRDDRSVVEGGKVLIYQQDQGLPSPGKKRK